MAQLINEAKRFQKLAGLITESQLNEADDKKWELVGPSDSGPYSTTWYKTFITPEMKGKIEKELGISDGDIEITHDEMQEDRSMWFTNVKINTNALPEDKKSSYKGIVRNIIEPAEEKSTSDTAPKDAPITKKSGIIDKVKSFFGKKQQESQLNEDILELKQMSKQLYSFLKKKGFLPELRNQLQKGKPAKVGEGENAVQIVVTDKPDERVMVAITAPSVAKVMVGGGSDWNYKATQRFGQDITSNAMNAASNWYKNPEILKYVDNLGNEILKQIFTKYPNMEYAFGKQDGFWYTLEFRFKTTAEPPTPV